MPRKTMTKTTVDTATVVDSATVADVDMAVEENTNDKKIKETKIEPLEDSDEIEVMSLVPNVSYKDSKSEDMYEWETVGHIEYMTVETLKNMWRNNKGYFRNMCLKPNDDRVIDKFGLRKIYEKYEYLMDESNYTRDKIEAICSVISDVPNGLKCIICNKLKNLVTDGKISDVTVIKTLENHLGIDLLSFL